MSGADAPQRSGGHSGRLDVGKPKPGTPWGASAHLARCNQAPRTPAPVTLARPFCTAAGRLAYRSRAVAARWVQPPARRASPAAARRRHRPFRAGAEFGSGDGGGVRPSRAGPTPAAPMTRTSRGHMADLAQDRAPRRHQAASPGGAMPPEDAPQPSERRRPVPMRLPAAPARPIGPLRAGPPRERGPRSDVHEYRKRPPPVNPDPDHDALLPSL